ncbi:MAG: PAS domain-containing protein, partial [Nitrospirales bacterium]
DGAQLGTWEINLQTGRMLASPRMNGMVGVQKKASVRRLDDWWERVHPDDRLRLHTEIADALARLTIFETEFRVVWPDRTVRWLLPKGKIVRDEEKRPIRAAGVAMDITARHQAEEERAQLLHEAERREQELRQKQAQLVQSANLASLGELTTGVAHELNNPLNNINLIVGNLIDQVHAQSVEREGLLVPLKVAMAQVPEGIDDHQPSSGIRAHGSDGAGAGLGQRGAHLCGRPHARTITTQDDRADRFVVSGESRCARQPHSVGTGLSQSSDQCARCRRFQFKKIHLVEQRRAGRHGEDRLS